MELTYILNKYSIIELYDVKISLKRRFFTNKLAQMLQTTADPEKCS